MTTQYSPILKLALPVQGELSGTWGDVVNDNITSMVEQAIAGRAVINTWSTNSHSLTSANGTTSESRCAMLELTDTGTALSGAGTVICPALSKIYIVKNAAGQNITVKTASGTGILVPDGRTTFLFCDGTNVVEALTHTTSLQLGTSTTVTAVLDEDNMASDSPTSLATQQSIKAYVDSKVGQFDSLAEVLAVGNTTGSNNIIVDNGQKITTNTIDETTAGSGVTIDSVLLKDDGVNATNLEVTNIKANDGTAAGSIADSTGVVTVASAVLTTADINGGTADGVVIGGSTPAAATVTTATANTSLNIAGTVTVTSILDEDNMASNDPAGLATQQSIKAYVDSQVGAFDSLAEVLAVGNTTGGTDLLVSTGDDITFADNSKAIFGDDSDLQIYHDGSQSRIVDTGTGNLKIQAQNFAVNNVADDENMITAEPDGFVKLFHNGSEKLATTATGISVTGNIANASGDLTLDVAGDIILDAAGTQVILKKAGTQFGEFLTSSTPDNLYIKSSIQDKDIIFGGNDGGSAITALTLDMSASGRATFNNNVVVTDGNALVAGNSDDFQIYHSSNQNVIQGVTSDQDIIFKGNDGGATITALTLDMSEAGAATFNGNVLVPNKIEHVGDADTYLQFSGGDDWRVVTGNVERFSINNSAVVVNEESADLDFRVESNALTNAFVIDGGNSGIGFGATPRSDLHASWTQLFVGKKGSILSERDTSGGIGQMSITDNLYMDSDTGSYAYIETDQASQYKQNAGVHTFRHAVSGSAGAAPTLIVQAEFAPDEAVFNNGGADIDFRVESNDKTHMLFVDAGNNRVGINEPDPQGKLHIRGNNDQQGATLFLQEDNNNTSDFLGTIYFGNNADDTLAHITSYTNTNNTTSLLQFNSTDTGSIRRNLDLGPVSTVFNQDAANIDFRVESNNSEYMLYLDAGQDTVGIKTNATDAALNVNSQSNVIDGIRVVGSGGNNFISGYGNQGNISFSIYENGADDPGTFKLFRNGTASVIITADENTSTVFNEQGEANDFRIESANNANMFVVDASADIVNMGNVFINGNNGPLKIGGSGYVTNPTTLVLGQYTSNRGYIQVPNDGDLEIWDGGTNVLALIGDGGTVFNENSADRDFRVESDAKTHMLFVDASANRIGINDPAPASTLSIIADEAQFIISGSTGGNARGLKISTDTTGYQSNDKVIIDAHNAASGEIQLKTQSLQRLKINSSETTFNEDSYDTDFRVESNANANMFVVNAGDSTVGIGASPSNNYRTLTVVNALDTDNSQIHIHGGNSGIYIGESYTGGFGPNAAIARALVAGYHISSSAVGDLCIGAETAAGIRFGTQASGTSLTNRMYITSSGAVQIAGSLSKGSGSFNIDHPLPEKTETHHLVHSFVEAPQADNIYRGKIDLVAGQATANIDTVAGMTDGTFATLNREIQCFTSNETGWTAVRGSVSGNILTIEAQDNTCTDTVSWLVVGERQDQHMYDTDWTDDNGKVIVEPLKENA